MRKSCIGDAGSFAAIGEIDFNEHVDKSSSWVKKQAESSERPLGEWNVADVECHGDSIRAYVNRVLQNKATGVTITPGKICISE